VYTVAVAADFLPSRRSHDPDLSTRRLRYLTVNHHHLVRASEVDEGVTSKVSGGELREALRGAKRTIFRWKLEVQIKGDSEHAKDVFRV